MTNELNSVERLVIEEVDPKSIGRVASVVTFLLTCFWVVPMVFVIPYLSKTPPKGTAFLQGVTILLVYPLLAFISGQIIGVVTNWAIRKVGGIEINVRRISNEEG
ncbi:hypothetical protein HOH87_04675 [bacterium]|jgi:hypothetical protein|nr:hypothetical protein [bacterium]